MSSVSRCEVCPHRCAISPGKVGICGARGNENGRIVSLNYGQCTALALDPIEKKPFARFHPGSMILSFGSFGCNLKCQFCQNSSISMVDAMSASAVFVSPETLVDKALSLKSEGNIGLAITYNEPLISPEFITDTGRLLHENDLLCALVTNGYANPSTVEGLLPFIDAMNIDLKSFSDEGYRKLGAPDGLDVVKRTIEMVVSAGIHVEITTLVVPGISSDENDFEAECRWLESVDRRIPLHISRFFPSFNMQDTKATDIGLLHRFSDIAHRHLDYVCLGNI